MVFILAYFICYMGSVYFASTNHNKYLEIESILQKHHISVEFSKIALTEIQSDSIKEIAIEKSKNAFSKISRPVIVEDDGLFIYKLNGFPGQYSSYIYKTIGNDGIFKLLNNSKHRFAVFKSFFAFCCEDLNPHVFKGKVEGKISNKVTEGGWGYDPIFIPNGSNLTFGQLYIQNRKIEFSHRSKALSKFAKWHNQKYK